LISLDGSGAAKQGEGKGKEEGEEVDQMERFLGLVDWGNVPKPAEWVDGAYDDAEGEGEVEDIDELAKRIGAVDVSRI
jgi:hypothetical protein